MNKLQVTLEGVPEAIAALGKFNVGVQRRQTRIALAAAGGVVKQEVIKRAPVEYGTLRKYQIVKTSLTKDRTSAYTIVGAKRGVKVAVSQGKDGAQRIIARFTRKKDGTISVSGGKRLSKAQAAGKSIVYKVPSRYSHLAERKTHYLARSLAASKYRAAQAAIDKLRTGVAEETRKAASRVR